jgi:hypothetical protein
VTKGRQVLFDRMYLMDLKRGGVSLPNTRSVSQIHLTQTLGLIDLMSG